MVMPTVGNAKRTTARLLRFATTGTTYTSREMRRHDERVARKKERRLIKQGMIDE